MIVGFKGWGNALNISEGMAAYLIRTLKAEPFARIKPDPFYRYDEHRPVIDVKAGTLTQLTPPGGAFYAPSIDLAGRTPIILTADEPDLGWYRFADDVFSVCETLGIDTVITLGSMFDSVLHTDRTLSAIASSEDLFERLRQRNVYPISYRGPSAIHSVIHAEAVASADDQPQHLVPLPLLPSGDHPLRSAGVSRCAAVRHVGHRRSTRRSWKSTGRR